MTPIAIPDPIRREIYAHALAVFPSECCGYLVGRAPDVVEEAVACTNAQRSGEHPITPDRTEETGFVISGRELLEFARSFDSERPARIVYHSHTNGAAYFSDIDRSMAEGPSYPVQHVVMGVGPGEVTEVAQFAWSDETKDFIEVARWRP
ncbi:MAG: Mov34/MPN/PAD-1 family protein [Kofleriaceae bacterium]